MLADLTRELRCHEQALISEGFEHQQSMQSWSKFAKSYNNEMDGSGCQVSRVNLDEV